MKSGGYAASMFTIFSVTMAALVVTTPVLAASKTNAPEAGNSKFEQLAQDPYLKLYGPRAGEGWLPVLETDTDIRFSGFIQLNVIHDFKNAGYPYGWFIPALISVPTDDTPNTEFDARASRFVFETRSKTKEVGNVSTFISMDFYAELGSTPQPRLRQAYITWVGPESHVALTVGQAWTTYIDLGVWPAIADMQGPNAMTAVRQGLIRGSRAMDAQKNLVLDISIEQPETLVQNGIGLTDWPDVAARIDWQQDWGHLRVMALARNLVAESLTGSGRDSAFGYGLSLSGSWKVPGTERASALTKAGSRQDLIQFQIQAGSGTGRYVNDLGALSAGQDGVYVDATQSLEPLDQAGYFVAYRHWWADRYYSTFAYGVEEVDNLSSQPNDAYHRGTYALVNLGYKAFTRMNIGLEYTWGEHENKDGQTGKANRINLAFNYGF